MFWHKSILSLTQLFLEMLQLSCIYLCGGHNQCWLIIVSHNNWLVRLVRNSKIYTPQLSISLVNTLHYQFYLVIFWVITINYAQKSVFKYPVENYQLYCQLWADIEFLKVCFLFSMINMFNLFRLISYWNDNQIIWIDY
jgi:hypothetical protein